MSTRARHSSNASSTRSRICNFPSAPMSLAHQFRIRMHICCLRTSVNY